MSPSPQELAEPSTPQARERADNVNAHAPRVGFFKRLLGPLHYSGSFWLRVNYWVSTRLPEVCVGPLLWVCVRFSYCVLPSVRRALGANQALVLGPAPRRETRRRVLRSLDLFSWCLVERWERFDPKRPFDIRVEGIEHWEAANQEGVGILLVTAHVGMWEAASRMAADKSKREVHLVREPEMDLGTQSFLEDLLARDRDTTYVTHFADNPMLGIELMNALRAGNLVALQGDRPRTGGRAIPTTLFGEPFEIPAGLTVLARSTACPLLPVFALREGRRRYRVRFSQPLLCPVTSDRQADTQVLAEALSGELEQIIRQAPEQWFKFGGN